MSKSSSFLNSMVHSHAEHNQDVLKDPQHKIRVQHRNSTYRIESTHSDSASTEMREIKLNDMYIKNSERKQSLDMTWNYNEHKHIVHH